MFIIGDVHDRYVEYEALLASFKGQPTLQIGDLGIGWPDGKLPKFGPEDYFFRGNHDNPSACNGLSNHIGSGGSFHHAGKSVFYVAGAWSIDWRTRTEGVDWWRDEELSISRLTALIDLYEFVKPEIMISHDGPESITKKLLNYYSLPGCLTAPHKTRTGQALEAMFRAHKPRRWIFGHYHIDWKRNEQGTEFQCLAPLSWTEV